MYLAWQRVQGDKLLGFFRPPWRDELESPWKTGRTRRDAGHWIRLNRGVLGAFLGKISAMENAMEMSMDVDDHSGKIFWMSNKFDDLKSHS